MAEAFRIAGRIDVDSNKATRDLKAWVNVAQQAAITATVMANKANAAATKVEGAAKKLGDAGKKTKETGKEFGAAMAAFGSNQLVGQLQSVARYVFGATTQMQGFRGTLQAVTGSIDEANRLLARFSEIANNTPFDLPEVVGAGVKFKAMNLEVERNIQLAGTLAATFGTDLGTAVEAVGKSLTGSAEGVEMLRNRFAFSRQDMERFGVTLDKQGQVILRGTADIKAMQKALEAFANEKGGEALAIRAKDLGTAFSNFTGKVFELAASIGDSLSPTLITLLDYGQRAVDWMKTWDPTTKALTGTVIFLGAALGTVATVLAPLMITIAGLTAIFGPLVPVAASVTGGVAAVGTAAAAATPAVTALGLASAGVFAVGFFMAIAAGVNALKNLRAELANDSRYFGLLKEQAEGAAEAIQAVANARAGGPPSTAFQQAQAAVGYKATIQEQLEKGDLAAVLETFKQQAEVARQARELGRSPNNTPEQTKQLAEAMRTFVETAGLIRATLGNLPASAGAAFEGPLSMADSFSAMADKLFARGAEAKAPAAAGHQDRPLLVVQNELEQIEHEEKIGKLSADNAAQRRAAILEELRLHKDQAQARGMIFDLEEKGHDHFQKLHSQRLDAIQAETDMLGAQGRLTPQKQIEQNERERAELQYSFTQGLIPPEEYRKQLQALAIDDAKQRHQISDNLHQRRLDQIKEETALLEAQGKLTPQRQLQQNEAERGEVRFALAQGTISPEEARKQLQDLAIDDAKVNRQILEQRRDTQLQLTRLYQGDTAARLQEIDNQAIKLREAGVAEVDIAKITSAQKQQVWADEAQARIDSEERTAQRLATARNRILDAQNRQLQARAARGEDVQAQLRQNRLDRGENEANDITRASKARVASLRNQRNRPGLSAAERNRLDAEIAAEQRAAEIEVTASRSDADVEVADMDRENRRRGEAARTQNLQLRQRGLGMRQDVLEQGVRNDAPGAAQALLQNLQAQHDLQLQILDAEKQRALEGANAAERANIEAEYAMKAYEARLNTVKALEDANKLIDEQKNKEKMDRAKKGGGFDFTTGNIYGSVAEAFAGGAGSDSGSYAAWLERRTADRAQAASNRARARAGLPHLPGPGQMPGALPPFMDPAQVGAGTSPRLTGIQAGSAITQQINAAWRSQHVPAGGLDRGYNQTASADVHIYVHEPSGNVSRQTASVPLGPPGSEQPGNPRVPPGRA